MFQSFKCCAHCIEDLNEISPELAEIWINLCDRSLDSRGFLVFYIENDINVELAELEDLGFLVTLETDDSLIARMEGIIIDAEDWLPCFCINYEEHSELPDM